MLNLQKQKEDQTQASIDKGLERLAYWVNVPMNPSKDTQDGNTGGDNGRYGAYGTNGVFLGEAKWACHSRMAGFSNAVVVFNQYGHRKNLLPEADREYLSWIMSDDGPWKSFRGRNISHVPTTWDKTVKEFIFENGWVWSDLDKHPSNLQHNFLVAARMAQEWQSFINRWYEWQRQGLNKALCFIFLDVFSPLINDLEKFQIIHKNKYDWPVDVSTSGEEYIRNFCLGIVENLNPPYSQQASYTPVNRIFGNNTLVMTDPKAYPNVIHSLYSGKFGPGTEDCKKYWDNRGTGMSVYDYRNHWYVSEKDILEIIKLETERLGV